MALLRITEFSGTMQELTGRAAVPLMPPLAHQSLTIGTEVKSSAFNTATRMIRVQAEGICCVTVSNDGLTAATTDMIRMTAGMTEYFGVSPSGKLSAITST